MRYPARRAGLLAAACCLLLLAACGPSASAPAAPPAASAPASAPLPASGPTAAPATGRTHPPAVQQLVDGARREGELNLVLSSSFFNRGAALPEFQQAFNDYYGLNTTIRRTVGPSMPQVAALVAQEVQAQRRPQTDLFHGSDIHIGTLLKADALQAIDWHTLDPRLPPNAIAEGSVGVGYGSSFSGMTYNTSAIPPAEVPRTLEAVLQPKWKGRIASTPYAAGFPQLARTTAWGEARTAEYVRKLADQAGGLVRCGEYERLLSGEYDMLLLNCGVAADQAAARDVMPIGFAVPGDAPAVSYYSWGVPKGSAHPNTATLFALFMLSEVGQRLSYSADFMDLHLLPGSQSVALVKPLLDQGVRLMGEDSLANISVYAPDSGRLEQELQRLLAKQ